MALEAGNPAREFPRSPVRRLLTPLENGALTDVLDEVKLATLALLSKTKGKEPLFGTFYHRLSGMLETIGYPSVARHEVWIKNELAETRRRTPNKSVLLCGAMSPISISQTLEMMYQSGYRGGELTVVDIARHPYESAASTLQKIAGRGGIDLKFVQEDIRTFTSKEKFGVVMADQVFNFLPLEEWEKTVNHLTEMVDDNGELVNICAVYKKQLRLGDKARSLMTKIAANTGGRVVKLTPSKRYAYTQLTGLINDQEALVVPVSRPNKLTSSL